MTLPFAIPVVETARLTLREPRESDLEALVAFGAGTRAQFMGGPYDRYGAWRVLIAGIGHWALRGYGFWSVDRKSDGAFIGRVGVIFPPVDAEPELAYHLFEGFEGQGFATEAVLAARAHAYGHMGLGPLVSCIDARNAPSLALARRVGAWFEREMVEDGCTLHVYRHPAPGHHPDVSQENRGVVQ
jgi:RimJ/RimL family protein N-acetyltransferase